STFRALESYGVVLRFSAVVVPFSVLVEELLPPIVFVVVPVPPKELTVPLELPRFEFPDEVSELLTVVAPPSVTVPLDWVTVPVSPIDEPVIPTLVPVMLRLLPLIVVEPPEFPAVNVAPPAEANVALPEGCVIFPLNV